MEKVREVRKLSDISIYMYRPFEGKDAVIIEGFPSVGLVSMLAAGYIVSNLKLKKLGVIVSPHMPMVSVITQGTPSHPIRIYGNDKVVVFISEFYPPDKLILPLTQKIFEFMNAYECKAIITTEGIESGGEISKDVNVYGIATTEEYREKLKDLGIPLLYDAILTGVTGMLLNEGERTRRNVVGLIAESHKEYPDARAAAKIVEKISALVNLEIDVEPLYQEAEVLERKIKSQLEKAKPHIEKHRYMGMFA